MVPKIASRRDSQKVNFCFYLVHFGHMAGVPKLHFFVHHSCICLLMAAGGVWSTIFNENVPQWTPKGDPKIDHLGDRKRDLFLEGLRAPCPGGGCL